MTDSLTLTPFSWDKCCSVVRPVLVTDGKVVHCRLPATTFQPQGLGKQGRPLPGAPFCLIHAPGWPV